MNISSHFIFILNIILFYVFSVYDQRSLLNLKSFDSNVENENNLKTKSSNKLYTNMAKMHHKIFTKMSRGNPVGRAPATAMYAKGAWSWMHSSPSIFQIIPLRVDY